LARTFVGIGFGPIQSGLFLLEAYESGNFDRFVVAEVATDLVDAVRRSGGKYAINIAETDGVRTHVVEGLEIYSPNDATDRAQLVSAIASADEIATALPSVQCFDRGAPSPAELLAQGFHLKLKCGKPTPTVVYAAENHNQAAELLDRLVQNALQPEERLWLGDRVQFVNTVIGKMSGVVANLKQVGSAGLQPLVESGTYAALVEQFNHILIERIKLPGFQRGLNVFEEKLALLPFEEAKLYGHNAAHALLGFLAHLQGLCFMSETRQGELLHFVERAFLEESGEVLCRRHHGTDPLFTESGWEEYVRDLLSRMTNPHLQDRVDRVIRDPQRKLGWDDRLIGTMRLALQYGVRPRRYTLGAAAAVQLVLAEQPDRTFDSLLRNIWGDVDSTPEMQDAVLDLIHDALGELRRNALNKV